jgi:hypothetical protein
MEKAPGQTAFDNANRQIISGREGVAFGNTSEARALAQEYSKTLKILRETLFTERNKNAFSIAKGEFLTYCHLDRDHCVFLVHVPELRHFVSDAKGSLADLAWMNAQSIIQTKLVHPPRTLALSVKGVLLYDSILIGDYVSEPTNAPGGDGIKTHSSGLNGMMLLYPLFQSEEAPQAPSLRRKMEMELDVGEVNRGIRQIRGNEGLGFLR